MSSAEAALSRLAPVYDGQERRLLLDVARRSIEHGFRAGVPLRVELDDTPAQLREIRASFTTLRKAGALRGCIGTLEPRLPLVADVAETAFKAAFQDPRFEPLTREELQQVAIHLSVLSPLEPFPVAGEQELLCRVRPGVDGLVLQDGPCRGTFLPAVWESLPDPRQFVRELKHKAGLPGDHWSPDVRIWRYTVDSIDSI